MKAPLIHSLGCWWRRHKKTAAFFFRRGVSLRPETPIMAKKRKSDATRLDEADRTVYATFCGAANSLSQLYSLAMSQQKLAFQSGERHSLVRILLSRRLDLPNLSSFVGFRLFWNWTCLYFVLWMCWWSDGCVYLLLGSD